MRSFGCPESAPHRRTSPLEPSLKDHIVTASVGLTRPEDDWVHWLFDNKARLSKLSNQPDPYMPLYQELLLYLYDLQIVTHTEFSNSVFRRLFLFHAQEFSVSLFGHVSYVPQRPRQFCNRSPLTYQLSSNENGQAFFVAPLFFRVPLCLSKFQGLVCR